MSTCGCRPLVNTGGEWSSSSEMNKEGEGPQAPALGFHQPALKLKQGRILAHAQDLNTWLKLQQPVVLAAWHCPLSLCQPRSLLSLVSHHRCLRIPHSLVSIAKPSTQSNTGAEQRAPYLRQALTKKMPQRYLTVMVWGALIPEVRMTTPKSLRHRVMAFSKRYVLTEGYCILPVFFPFF